MKKIKEIWSVDSGEKTKLEALNNLELFVFRYIGLGNPLPVRLKT